jgi:hypothetical protein
MSNAAIRLIHDEMVEEDNANHAEIRNLLSTMGGLNAEFSIVVSHIAEGNYSAATSILNAIPATINLSDDYLDDYNQFKSLKELEINVLNSGRDWSSLNSSEISQLQSVADSDEGMAAGQAQGVMNFFYDGEYTEEPTWTSTGSQRIGVRRTPDRDKLSADVVSVFPNPVKDLLICQYILPEGKESALLTIRNSFGEAVKVFDIERREGQITYDTENLTSGLYFYTMRIDGFEEKTGEFVVVK